MKQGSKTRNAQYRTAASRTRQALREGRCGHVWRVPDVGGPPRRICKLCGRVEWLTPGEQGGKV